MTKETVEDFGSKSISSSSGFSRDKSEGNCERGTGDTFKKYIRLYKPVRNYKYTSRLEYYLSRGFGGYCVVKLNSIMKPMKPQLAYGSFSGCFVFMLSYF